MICCKIIADYNNPNGHFQKMLENLSKYGEWLWENNVLFFSETETNAMTERKIINIVKRSGYSKCFVDVYDKNNVPQESNNANIWLTNKLIRINYNQCEHDSQQVFHNISCGLDMIDQELEKLRETKEKETQEAELQNGNRTKES